MLRVLHVASEVAPFAQSGGLADVVAGLPNALAESLGVPTGVIVPLYRTAAVQLAAGGHTLQPGPTATLRVGPHAFEATLRRVQIGHVTYGFVDCAALYDRDGTLYGPGGTAEFADNHLRYGALGQAALAFGDAVVGGPVDVLHVHDWQGAPAAIYARLANTRAAIVATIHNLAFRGIFPKSTLEDLGLPWSVFNVHAVEFWDQVCLLKGGLAAADVVTTVSPSYAREILTIDRGEGLDGFLRWDVKRLAGIVNGIDTKAWDPASDPALAAPFSANSLAGKARCRLALTREVGLPGADDDALVGVIARMSDQKGIDLIAEIAPDLARLGARLIVLGAGEPAIEQRLLWLADVFREHVAVHIGFESGLARRIYAGSDLFAMPSRFEPCGLGQLYAMRYGTIPIVHAVGGLRDTVIDPGDAGLATGQGTGIRFDQATAQGLIAAIGRGVATVRSPSTLATVRRTAMTRDSSWTASAQQYLQLYRSVRAPSS